jgi:small subunit ribosomal protein S16
VAVKLRLMRMGKKKQPTYRVVAADSRSPRNGRFLEIVGTYEPRLEPSGLKVDNERALHWLRHGAQPTERVEKLLRVSGAWEEFTGEKGPATYPEQTKPAPEPEPPAEPAPAASEEPAPAPAAEATDEPAADADEATDEAPSDPAAEDETPPEPAAEEEEAGS